ncbi:MAG: sigma 54-interacting transcriptional regulator [Planctomycetota bacterium]
MHHTDLIEARGRGAPAQRRAEEAQASAAQAREERAGAAQAPEAHPARTGEAPAEGPLELLLVGPRALDLEPLLSQAGGGLRVTTRRAAHVREAQALLRTDGYDLALVDLEGPGAPAAALRALHQADPALPVIAVSPERARGEAAVAAGAQDWLPAQQTSARELERTLRIARLRARRRAELLASHARLERALDESDHATLVLDPEGTVLYLNPAAERLGLPRRLLGARISPPDGAGATLPLDDGLASVHAADTLWRGRLARLVSVLAFTRPPTPGEPGERAHPSRYEGLRTASPAMRRVFETCERVAPTEATVLLLGETGTGKELLARALHSRSGRGGRFVAIDCGAIPEALLESELFGHEPGAFTGAARRRAGAFERAQRGTLLLDEIGNLSAAAQHSLLRVLQERRVRPLGAERELAVDVRVVAATSAPLFEAVQAGTFRQDLLYRLDVIRVELPPLRARPEDVLHLFRLFCRELAERYELSVPAVGRRFLDAMLRHAWPGNVRQLENFTERLLLTGAECQDADDFQELVRPAQRLEPDAPRVDLARSLADHVAASEQRYLEAALRERGGRVQETADLAGINRRTLLRKLRRYGIDKRGFRGGAGR